MTKKERAIPRPDGQHTNSRLLTLGGLEPPISGELWGLFAARISTESAAFLWVTVVSYAMLGGLIARMIVMPIGPFG